MDVIGNDFFTEEQKLKIEALGLIVGYRRPLIELLYILVRQRPTEGYRKDQTLISLLDQIALSGILPVISDPQQYTIDHAKADIYKSIEDTKALLKKHLKQEILDVNQEYKQEIVKKPSITVPETVKLKNSLLGPLLVGLGAVMLGAHKTFIRSFTSQMTDLVNNAVVDEATTVAILKRLPVQDLLCYKIVKDDSRLCNWCHRFYLNKDGTPRIYKLSELLANGVNDPSDKASWKAVIGRAHINCRCELRIIKP
jgi:hypothetical protein